MREHRAAYSGHCIFWTSSDNTIRGTKVVLVDIDSFDKYHKDMPPAPKLPGGDAKSEDEGNPKATARREGREETGLDWREDASPVEIYSVYVNGHEKFFFALLIDVECEGELKLFGTVEENSVLSPPYLMPALEVPVDEMPRDHREAYRCFLDRLRTFYRFSE